MKILRNILCAVMSVAVLASCSSLSKLAGNMDYQNGSTTGSVLVNLLSQFKNSGTVNLTSGQNLLNIASLATALTSLRNNAGTAANTAANTTSTAVKNFTQGLLATSQNAVNSNNVQSVISGLTTLANTDLTGIQQSLQQGQTNASTSSFSSSLLGLLGGLLNK